jgi:uracil-DNA glycosylase family 4
VNGSYQRVLESTEQHLHALKARGVRFLNVQSETLAELRRPPAAREASQPAQTGQSSAGDVRQEPEAPPVAEPAIQPPGGLAAPPAPVRIEVSALNGNGLGAQLDKAAAMEQLRGRAKVCMKCPHLARSRKNVVFGVGDIHSPLMFVGEAPGADEDQQGEPFVGLAGQLLTRVITTMGFSRETVYIANILKCRPDTPGQTWGNRKPTPDEMRTCLPYSLAQIDLIAPKVIVALGVTAVEGLFGKCEGINKLRGNFQAFRGIPLMPTYHPAYLLRTQALSDKRKVWEDMLQVLEKLGRPISDKQRGYFLKG